ncbi:MAG: polysaccharide deacetylase family protein [Candidatus Tyrphobacter sp.]
MKRGLPIVVALVVLAAIAFGVRAFLHASNQRAAVLTPAMNAHREFSNALGPRIYRALHARTVASPSAREKLVALTFDDGPYPIFTPLLLDRLHDLRVHATFFLIGRDAQEWPSITQRIEAAGNEIGDHTYSHPDLDRETPSQVREEILRGRDVLFGLTHDTSVRWMMRPPHGRYTEQTLSVAQSLGYHVILWTDDSGDWRSVTSEQIVAHVRRFATEPEILLLHSGKLATIEALPSIVKLFDDAGYRFVTVGQILQRAGTAAVNHPLHHALARG